MAEKARNNQITEA
ncbi:hypothetical protein AYI69_g8837, partial [Smittium culicis]